MKQNPEEKIANSHTELESVSSVWLFEAKGYEMLELLGKGGMGAVYKAKQVLTGRIVAIKVLSGDINEKTLGRFKQEAHAACAFSHPNVVSIFDFGISANSEPFIVMEYLQGISLAERIETLHKLPESEALPIFLQSADALSAAHAAGVVHRDLKPANMLLQVDHKGGTRLKILDFGIAKLVNSDANMSLTDTGEVFGSPFYMSPEQCSGLPVDARTDMYSLGCVMYEAMTGTLPHTGENPLQVICKRLNEKPQPFAQTGTTSCSKELEKIIFKCLATKPEQRYQTMRELLAALETLSPGATLTQPASGSKLVIAGIAAAILLGGIACGTIFLENSTFTAPASTAVSNPGTSIPATRQSTQTASKITSADSQLTPDPARSASDYLDEAVHRTPEVADEPKAATKTKVKLAKLGILAAHRDGSDNTDTAYELHCSLASWLMELERPDAAANEYSAAASIARNQNNVKHLINALSAQGEQTCYAGKTEEGIGLIRQSVALVHEHNVPPCAESMDALKRLGMMLARAEQFDEAYKTYQTALNFGANSNDQTVQQALGYTNWFWAASLHDRHMYKEAQIHFDEALKHVIDAHWRRHLYEEIAKNCESLGDKKHFSLYKAKADAALRADPDKG